MPTRSGTVWADPQAWLPAALGLAVGLVVGALVASLVAARRLSRLETERAVLKADVERLALSSSERDELLDQASDRLAMTFDALADRHLSANSETFLRLAREHLAAQQASAAADLSARGAAVEALIAPIGDALAKTREHVERLERDRLAAFGGIRQQLAAVAEGERALRDETANLVRALRRPEVRGRWGEMTLKRLVEIAGMVDKCDFLEQPAAAGGALRPDMVVRMPESREIVVDVKTPLDAYLSAIEAPDAVTRESELKRHARIVQDRVRELGGKSYWAQFPSSPEFVVLFVPGEQFLAAALDIDPALFDDALSRKVIPATPTSLIALLKTVAYGWRQLALAENAGRIRDLAEELYDRLGAFTGHLSTLGTNLKTSVETYNRAVGSLERKVLPGARRFRDFGIQARRELDTLEPLEQATRDVRRPDDEE